MPFSVFPDLISRAEALVAENKSLKAENEGRKKSPSTLPSTTIHVASQQQCDIENDGSDLDLLESHPTPKAQSPKLVIGANRLSPEIDAAKTNDDDDLYDIGDIFEVDDGKSARKVKKKIYFFSFRF